MYIGSIFLQSLKKGQGVFMNTYVSYDDTSFIMGLSS